jgi:hypothetical protein
MAITINGQSFTTYANIVPKPRKAGRMHTALSGKRNWLHRANKRDFEITWKGADATVFGLVNTAYALTGPVTYVHEDAVSYTVLIDPSGFKIEPIQVGDTTLLYNLTLVVLQQ